MGPATLYLFRRKVSFVLALVWILLATWSAATLRHLGDLDIQGVLSHSGLFLAGLAQVVLFFRRWNYAFAMQAIGLVGVLVWLALSQASIGFQIDIALTMVLALIALCALVREKLALEESPRSTRGCGHGRA